MPKDRFDIAFLRFMDGSMDFFIFMLTKKYICGITFISVGDIMGFMPYSKQGAEQFGSFQCHAESIHFEKKLAECLCQIAY